MRSVLLALIVKTFLSQVAFGEEPYAIISSCFTMTAMYRRTSHRFNETDVLLLKEKNSQPISHVTSEARLPIQFIYSAQNIQKFWNGSWIYKGIIDNQGCFRELIAAYQERIINGTSSFINIFTRTESMWTILLLLLIFRVFLQTNITTELQLLSLIFIQMEPSFATLTPPLTSSSTSHVVGGHVPDSVNNVESIPKSNVEELALAQKLSGELNKQYYNRGKCDLGWYQFGSYCYMASQEDRIFDHAQRSCEYHNANLLSISNEAENEIALNISKDFLGFPRRNFIWLGMERREATNRLHWIDESKIVYENWILGEPDSNGACVQMINKGLWEDTNCFQKMSFICKKVSSYPLPYTRTTEIGILVGIPFSFALIVLSFVGYLMFKSIRDADDTFFGYGKNRNKEKMHAALVDLTASIAHVSTQLTPAERREISPRKAVSRSTSRSHSLSSSHVNPAVEISDVGSQSPIQTRKENGHIPRVIKNKDENAQRKVDPEEIKMQVCVSSVSIEKEGPQFELATSLDQLVKVKPKGRRTRGLMKPDAAAVKKDTAYRKTTYV